eukprot:4305256-Alexandrium_andersonii.AAC.1
MRADEAPVIDQACVVDIGLRKMSGEGGLASKARGSQAGWQRVACRSRFGQCYHDVGLAFMCTVAL